MHWTEYPLSTTRKMTAAEYDALMALEGDALEAELTRLSDEWKVNREFFRGTRLHPEWRAARAEIAPLVRARSGPLEVSDCEAIRAAYATGAYTQAEIGKAYGVAQAVISSVCGGWNPDPVRASDAQKKIDDAAKVKERGRQIHAESMGRQRAKLLGTLLALTADEWLEVRATVDAVLLKERHVAGGRAD